MANLNRLVAVSFTSLVLLSSFVSTANLSFLLVTTFSTLRFLYNSLWSPLFNLLRVVWRCLSWYSVFLFSRLILSHSFLCSSVSEALFDLSSFLTAPNCLWAYACLGHVFPPMHFWHTHFLYGFPVHKPTYNIWRNFDWTVQWGAHFARPITTKMVPITEWVSSFFKTILNSFLFFALLSSFISVWLLPSTSVSMLFASDHLL